MKLTVLGCRGSMSVEGSEYAAFGGATSSYFVESDKPDGGNVYLDAGTGIVAAPNVEGEINVLISHPHLDHIQGIPFFPELLEKGTKINIYVGTDEAHEGYDAAAAINNLVSPPYWPVGLSAYPADVRVIKVFFPIDIKGLKVSAMEGSHPGGSLIFGIEQDGQKLVYATDYEKTEESVEELIEFAKDADIFMLDGQYTDEELGARKGYGHTSWNGALELAGRAHAKTLMIIHHDPAHNDDILSAAEKELTEKAGDDIKVIFARKGMILKI
ncbi:MAG: MBL fold metallo-hydrolase [Lachnospiraceae bacterium]|nr:MBL fold metallo-hydrolase [Lachnospiraceae bacterium]